MLPFSKFQSLGKQQPPSYPDAIQVPSSNSIQEGHHCCMLGLSVEDNDPSRGVILPDKSQFSDLKMRLL